MPEFDFTLPGELAIPVEGPATPVEPRDAATVVLLRDGEAGLEVFLQRRVAAMAFVPGTTVFPGGGVDARDADASVSWAGPPAADWADWFSATESAARALVCAAVRETFEESGVLLAGTRDAVVADTAQYAHVREALVSREVSLAGFLAGHGLTLRADLLRPLAHWITPVQEKRRYDTRFFVAVLPEGQDADGANTETESSGWQRPEDALADGDAGRSMLMPPTRHTLTGLTGFTTAAEAFAAERKIRPVLPTLVRDGDKVRAIVEDA